MTTESTHNHEAPEISRADRDTGREPVALVGYDRQQASVAALATAINLAERLGAHLHIVHSVTLDDYGIDPDTDAFEEERDRRQAIERTVIAAALTGVAWTYHEERGDPADRLARLADSVDADRIVVGVTKPGMLHHLLSGEPVPKRLVKVQHRPVVIVAPRTRPDGPSSFLRQRRHPAPVRWCVPERGADTGGCDDGDCHPRGGVVQRCLSGTPPPRGCRRRAALI